MLSIVELIAYIEKHTGKKFVACDQFPGLKTFHDTEHYYNLVLNDPYAESADVAALERLALNSSIISRVEPNGYKRVAIFLKNDR